MFLHAIRDALLFIALMIGFVGVPGILCLYSDWKKGKGWFDERA